MVSVEGSIKVTIGEIQNRLNCQSIQVLFKISTTSITHDAHLILVGDLFLLRAGTYESILL